MATQSTKPNISLADQGVLRWKLTPNLLRQCKNAKHEQKFVSKEFETIDGSVWRVQIYPRGDSSPDDCSLYLECVELGTNKSNIGVNYSLHIAEVNWSHHGAHTFIKAGETRGPSNAFKSETLNDLSTITIQCVVQETMDVTRGSSHFDWTINKHLIEQWKDSRHKEAFTSPSFHVMGGEWHLRLYPNGRSANGTAELEIVCQSIDTDEKEMNVSHYVDITQLNYAQIFIDGNAIQKGHTIECTSPFKRNDIQNQSEIVIGIKLWRTQSIPKGEARFLSHLYSENTKSLPQELKEYFITEGNISQMTKLLLFLRLTEYAAIFKAKGDQTTQQLIDLTDDDLAKMGVSVEAHRKAIRHGITSYFTGTGAIEQKQSIERNDGCMEWKVIANLLQLCKLKHFRNAKPKQPIYSPKFKTIDGSVWRMVFYPRGDTSRDECSIHLECVELAANKASTGVNYSLDIAEVDWSHNGGHTFRKDGDIQGPSNAFKSAPLNDLSAITIQCVVQETMTATRDTPYFEWTINKHLMQKCKEARHKEAFTSPSFNTMDAEWCLRVYPNGRSAKGTAELDLLCQSIGTDEKEMDVCEYVDMIDLDYSHLHLDGETMKAGDLFSFRSPFELNNIQEESELTISIKLWKKEWTDRYEARFISDSYANTKNLSQEWKECAMSQANAIRRFLVILELTKYEELFKKNEIKSMQDIEGLTDSECQGIGFKAFGPRKRIVKAINAYFKEFEEESKENDFDISNADDTSTKCYVNALVICIAIAKYIATLDNLDTEKDIQVYRALFEKQYNYTVIPNDPSKTVNPKDLTQFLRDARRKLYDFNEDKLNYDSLILTFGGHGTYDSIICSDGSPYKHKEIRDVFAIHELKDIPKIFIFDACRSDDGYRGNDKPKGRAIATATTFSSTLMTSEGHKVYGAQICKHVTQEFQNMCRKNDFVAFRNVCRAARDNIRKETNNEQDLVVCEHDYDIDDVIFKPRVKARGTKGKRYDADTKQMSVPLDFLGKFLTKIQMECYYQKFQEKGYDKKRMLEIVDEEALIQLGIDTQKDRKAILKAARRIK
eukprot:175374_1